PAPEGPMTASASPRASERFTPARITSSPSAVGYDLQTLATRRSAAPSVMLLLARRLDQPVGVSRRARDRFEFSGPFQSTEDCLEVTRRQARLAAAKDERHRQRLDSHPADRDIDLDQIVVVRRGLEAA